MLKHIFVEFTLFMAKNSEKIFKDSISVWRESYSNVFLWELGISVWRVYKNAFIRTVSSGRLSEFACIG